MKNMKINRRFLRIAVLLSLGLACASVMFWSSAGAAGVIEYRRTTAAAQQQGTCNQGDTCFEWCTRNADGTYNELGVFCCGNENQCSLVPGGPF